MRYVYFIQSAAGSIKIGLTNDPTVRLRSLQSASPVRLELLAAMMGSFRLERALHKKFAHLRIEGEWFNPSADLLADIERVKSNHRPIPKARPGRKPTIDKRTGEPKPLTLTARILQIMVATPDRTWSPLEMRKVLGFRDSQLVGSLMRASRFIENVCDGEYRLIQPKNIYDHKLTNIIG